MKSNQNRSISFIFFSTLYWGDCWFCSQSVYRCFLSLWSRKGFFFSPATQLVGGLNPQNWVDLFVIRFKTGFFVNISVVSILGMGIAWYFLRYFK